MPSYGSLLIAETEYLTGLDKALSNTETMKRTVLFCLRYRGVLEADQDLPKGTPWALVSELWRIFNGLQERTAVTDDAASEPEGKPQTGGESIGVSNAGTQDTPSSSPTIMAVVPPTSSEPLSQLTEKTA